MNESSKPFPEWLPKSVHHCIYDCLKCQIKCPMNKDHLKNIAGPVQFTESETDVLLSGVDFEEYPDLLKQKALYLGLNQWPDGISKNLKALMEVSESEPVV